VFKALELTKFCHEFREECIANVLKTVTAAAAAAAAGLKLAATPGRTRDAKCKKSGQHGPSFSLKRTK
jgi:hypothetical protein